MSRSLRSFFYLIGAVLVVALVYSASGVGQQQKNEVPITQVADQAKSGQVKSIEASGREVTVTTTDGKKEESQYTGESLPKYLKDLGVTDEQLAKIEIDEKGAKDYSVWINLAGFLIPLALIGFFLFFMLRQAQSGNNQALSFGRSKARLFNAENKKKITFADVAGSQESKEELREVVEFLKYPAKFAQLGAEIPKGVLLVGPPGTGKTLMARAVAGEADVPFFSISGSEFVEMFVGVGASRVRDLFAKAKRNAPCIIFIDEIDAVGRQRGAGLGGSHDEREQTLNQILTEMDGFEQGNKVIVMAATNRPDVLDPALLRPGRFDRRVIIDRPDVKEREAILEVHSKGKPLAKGVNLNKIARQTPGFAGADLKNLFNEAAILAARENKRKVGQAELTAAIEKVMLGPERKSRVMTDKDKKITAYHEAGHALVATYLEHCDPVHKVSIVSRGMAGGYTWYLPDEDRYLRSKPEFEDELAAMLAGNAVERQVFKQTTTGASNDIQKATELARQMVIDYGMSDKLGPIAYREKDELVFLGREMTEQKHYSDRVASLIDSEVKSLIDTAYNRATALVKKRRKKLDELASKLIEEETIEGPEFDKLFPDVAKLKKKPAGKSSKPSSSAA
ncbi:ATP-dependent metallopeptidase FtsH/Yme1/Tma family protein [Patescibacteria group bacterium]|nr:ATP-dependent metallopeptidase FtsH/Yme1/Tma family protein [Patescibacteria group bacterium]